MATSLDDQLLNSPEATFLIFQMEIITPALPPGRALLDTHPDKGAGSPSAKF